MTVYIYINILCSLSVCFCRVGEYVGEDDTLAKFKKVMLDGGADRHSPRAKRMHSRRSLDDASHRKSIAMSPATSVSSEDQNSLQQKRFAALAAQGGTSVDRNQNQSNNNKYSNRTTVVPICDDYDDGDTGFYDNTNESCNRSKVYRYRNFNANNDTSEKPKSKKQKSIKNKSKSSESKGKAEKQPENVEQARNSDSRDSLASEDSAPEAGGNAGRTRAAGSIGTINSIGSLADDEHSYLGSRDDASYSKNQHIT